MPDLTKTLVNIRLSRVQWNATLTESWLPPVSITCVNCQLYFCMSTKAKPFKFLLYDEEMKNGQINTMKLWCMWITLFKIARQGTDLSKDTLTKCHSIRKVINECHCIRTAVCGQQLEVELLLMRKFYNSFVPNTAICKGLPQLQDRFSTCPTRMFSVNFKHLV